MGTRGGLLSVLASPSPLQPSPLQPSLLQPSTLQPSPPSCHSQLQPNTPLPAVGGEENLRLRHRSFTESINEIMKLTKQPEAKRQKVEDVFKLTPDERSTATVLLLQGILNQSNDASVLLKWDYEDKPKVSCFFFSKLGSSSLVAVTKNFKTKKAHLFKWFNEEPFNVANCVQECMDYLKHVL
ncbi:hypothetical protein BDR26DRAFT_956596 [Obelidium mucronatum]|nr:hypothetical protein BDR26DRAFT_956596 [Obelidium mucronatum]